MPNDILFEDLDFISNLKQNATEGYKSAGIKYHSDKRHLMAQEEWLDASYKFV